MGAYTLQGETRVWRVHARDGVEVARVALPRKLDVFEIGADYVFGRMTGDFDEHLVVRFDLEQR